MTKFLRAISVIAVIALFVLSLTMTGCSRHPNEEQLQVLEDTKAAALEAEQKLSDCQENHSELESKLAATQQELEEVKEEKELVVQRLEAMEN